MQPSDVIDLGRQAMMMTLLLSSPVLVVAIVVGVLAGLLQAMTQMQDHAIALVPKIVAIFAALAISLPWLLEKIIEYSHNLFSTVPTW